jgi:hypothetical protein
VSNRGLVLEALSSLIICGGDGVLDLGEDLPGSGDGDDEDEDDRSLATLAKVTGLPLGDDAYRLLRSVLRYYYININIQTHISASLTWTTPSSFSLCLLDPFGDPSFSITDQSP